MPSAASTARLDSDGPPRAGGPWAGWPAVGSAVLAVALFAVTLGGTYVYDDTSIIRDDPRVHSRSQWGQLWTRDYSNGGLDNLYRPLVSTSYAVQWWLHGSRPWAFHAVNVLLHAGAAAAVAEVARRATGRAAAAWAAGLLFAAHPAHAEAVANIVGRAEVACGLGLMASFALLARRPLTPARAAAVLACGVAVLLSKEHGILAPVLWGLWVALVWRTRPAGGERAVTRGFAVVAVWAWVGYMAVRQHFLRFDWDRLLLDRVMQPMVHSVGVDRLLVPVAILGRYAALMAWPAHLSPDYGGDVIGSAVRRTDPYLWVGVAAAVAWAVGTAVAWRRRAGFPLFCLLAGAATYGLISNLVTLIGTIFGERLIYLPSAFLVLLAGAGLARLPAVPRAAILVAVLVPMSVRTVRAAAEWNRPAEMTARALRDYPGSVMLHLLVAEYDHDAGRVTDETAVMDDACRRFPIDWVPWCARARLAAAAGDFPLAEADMDHALTLTANGDMVAVRAFITEREAAAGWHRPRRP